MPGFPRVPGTLMVLLPFNDQRSETSSSIHHRPILTMLTRNLSIALTPRTADSPGEDVLVAMWFAWGAVFAASGLVSFVVWLGILSSRKLRNSPFNHILLWLMFPDWCYAICCSLTNFYTRLWATITAMEPANFRACTSSGVYRK